MRLDKIWRPFLFLLGGTPSKSYAEIEGGSLHLKFGHGFEATIPLSEIDEAKETPYSIWGGIGWRVGALSPSIALVGSTHGVVSLKLSSPRRFRVAKVPKTADLIYVSLEDPQAFLAELKSGGALRKSQ
jgi:hypothetical protein